MTKSTQSNEQKIDCWSKKGACVVCHDVCSTAEEKKNHETKNSHLKKLAVYKFMKLHFKSSNTNLPSALLRRFRVSKEKTAGLECINEIRFPFAASGWWLCNICHERGCTLEEAEHHVRSPDHLATYLEEFDPENAASLKKMKNKPVEYYVELVKARDQLAEMEGEIPPEVYEVNMTKDEAMIQLLVASLPSPAKETLTFNLEDDETVKRAIVRCTTCHEVIPCFRKNLNKAWSVHENTPEHRKASAILGILKYLSCEEVLEDEVLDDGPLAQSWRRVGNTFFGPVCGKSFLLTCGKQNFCLLCSCEVRSLEEHFSSEYHILRFLCAKKTQEMLPFFHQAAETRREKMMDLLRKIPMDNENYKKLEAPRMPEPIMEFLSPEKLEEDERMPIVEPFGFEENCMICKDCRMIIRVKKEDLGRVKELWNEHAGSGTHFDVYSRRNCFRFYADFFVPLLPTIKTLPPMLHGEWKDIVIDEKTSYKIQTHCDVGLEYIVEDQEVGEVVCTLCARTWKKDLNEAINNHIRSWNHLNLYLNIRESHFMALLWNRTENDVFEMSMDWLQKQYAPVQAFQFNNPHYMYAAIDCHNWGQIRVYSPEKATTIARKMDIPIRTLQLSFHDPIEQTIGHTLYDVVDKVAQDGFEKFSYNLQQTLLHSTCRIIYMDDEDNKVTRKWLIKCMACEMVFSSTVENLSHDIFNVHMQSEEHERRITALTDFQDDRYRYAENNSNYTVKPFVQPDPVKKLSWQFNHDTNKFQYVLSVVGLEELVERKSSMADTEKSPDFFCRLCAQSFPRRAMILEQHVRSRDHVYNYVQKTSPMTLFDLETCKDDPKQERRILANAVKDVKPPIEYPIPVFDPVGEQSRRAQEAEVKQKEKERMESLAISRKRAEQERIAREEQKKKILQREREAQLRIQEETKAREKILMEKHIKAKMDLKKEQERMVMEEAKRARDYALMQIEKQKDEKFKEERRREEKRNLLKELESLREKEEALIKEKKEAIRHMAQKTQHLLNKHHLTAPEQLINTSNQLIIPSQPISMMNIPPPPIPNLSIPPPNFKVNANYGSYIQTPGGYSTGPEDMDISRRSRSPSPRRRERERRRSRSRSRSRTRRFRRSRSPASKKEWKPHGLRDISPEGHPVNHRDRDYRDSRRSLSPVSISPPPDERRPSTKRAEKKKERPSLRGKLPDSYITNSVLCPNKAAVCNHIWRQGAEIIPNAELPSAFSKRATEIEGSLGVDSVFEVACVDNPDLDSFYCSTCGSWGSPDEMISHLATQSHKQAYIFRHNKPVYESLMAEPSETARTAMLQEMAIRIWKKDHMTAGIRGRLQAVVNRSTLLRIWPDFVATVEKSKQQSKFLPTLEVPAPLSQDTLAAFARPPPTFNPAMPPPGGPGFTNSSYIPNRTTVGYISAGGTFAPASATVGSFASQSATAASFVPPGSYPRSSSSWIAPAKDLDDRKRSRSPSKNRKRSRSRDRGHHRSPSPRRDFRRGEREKKRSRSRSKGRDCDDRRHETRDRRRSLKENSNKGSIVGETRWAEECAAFLQKTQPQTYVSQPPAVQQKPIDSITIDDFPNVRRDDPTLQRKLLGFIFMMQDEIKKSGRMDPIRLQQLYTDLRLNQTERESKELLSQLIQKFCSPQDQLPKVNLTNYGIPQPISSQYSNYSYPPPTTTAQQQMRDDPTLTRILSGIHGSLAQLKNDRPVSPIIKPLSYQFNRTEDLFKDSTFSMVYPNDPEELEREKKEKQERKKQASEQIQAKIEALKARAEQIQNAGDNEDDDWEGLENDLGLDLKKDSTPQPSSNEIEIIEVKRASFGVPTSWQQPVPQSIKPSESSSSSSVVAQELIPIVPGQKMPLQRTILPNGKAVPQETSKPAYNPPPVYQQPVVSTILPNVSAASYYQYQQPAAYQPPQPYSYAPPTAQPIFATAPPIYQQPYYQQGYQGQYQTSNYQQVNNIQQPLAPGTAPPGTQPAYYPSNIPYRY